MQTFMDKNLFNAILQDGRKADEVALVHVVSVRTVYSVREAGSWERWPYIMMKKRHGYMTPEYKKGLERAGLPLKAPAKPTGTITYKVKNGVPTKKLKKPSLFQGIINKLTRRKK